MMVACRRSLLALIATMVAAAATLSVSARLAQAEDPALADEILKALNPEHQTRSLSVSRPQTAVPAEQVRLVESLRNKTANSLAPVEREKLAAVTKDKPSLVVKINFDFDSDKIGPAAARAVDEIGKALSNSKLTGNTFVIAGHTDAKGASTYNQELSERRAESVKSYLIDKFK